MQNTRQGISAVNLRRIGVIMFGGCILSLLCVGGMAVAQTGGGGGGTKGYAAPIVYVADFQLGSEAEDKSSQRPLQVKKRIKDKVELLTGTGSPEERAKKIVDTLAGSIVEELTNKNVGSKRLYTRPAPASNCWVLEGEFVEYDEGDRLKRAVIGFGSGSVDMQVDITLIEMAEGSRSILLDSSMDGRKNRMPGAVVTMNPYVAGAKFVLTKNAPDREVKSLGSQIADVLYKFMKERGLVQP